LKREVRKEEKIEKLEEDRKRGRGLFKALKRKKVDKTINEEITTLITYCYNDPSR